MTNDDQSQHIESSGVERLIWQEGFRQRCKCSRKIYFADAYFCTPKKRLEVRGDIVILFLVPNVNFNFIQFFRGIFIIIFSGVAEPRIEEPTPCHIQTLVSRSTDYCLPWKSKARSVLCFLHQLRQDDFARAFGSYA
jgi:hypothetical protein